MANGLTVPKSHQVIEPTLKSLFSCRLADVYHVHALNPVLADEFRQAGRISLLERSACGFLQKVWHTIRRSQNQIDPGPQRHAEAASFAQHAYADWPRETSQRY